MVKIHQHVKFQAIPSMHSPANARKPLRTDGRTDGRRDGRTCRKMVTVGRVDQRTHVHVKRGYFRLRTDSRMDGQPENIMPPAPKGGGIKKWGHPLSWLVIGGGNSTSVYNESKCLTSSLDWNRATDYNNKPTRKKVGLKDSSRKYKESNLK